jgi:DNA polymerase family A
VCFRHKRPSGYRRLINGVDIHQKLADRVGLDSQDQGKRLRHGATYMMGAETYADHAGIPLTKAQDELYAYRQLYAQTFAFGKDLANYEAWKTPVLGRMLYFNEDPQKNYKRLNLVVQGSCVDLLIVCLEHVLKSNKYG